jgi:tetratricopeptide (TPR) repeat protein
VHLAATHIQAAIGCLERLPASPQTAERELELQILLAPLLMSVHGWGAVEVEQACTRALELTQRLQRPDRSYPPMWGLWTVRFLRSELSAATQAAEAVLAAAQASGVPMLEVTGRHALSFTLFSRGEYRRAIAEADAGLALFELEQERALAQAFGLSSTVALRASRADSLWMLGQVEAADEEYARLRALGTELGHPASHAASMAFALYGGVFDCSYTGQLDVLLPRIDQLAELSRDDDFFLWNAFAHTLRAVVAHSQGADSTGAGMLDGLAMWEQAGSRLTLVLMNTLCAQAFLSTGQLAEAAARLDAAEAMAVAGEAVMAPEIPRLRAQLFAARGEPSAAEASLRDALAQARAQDAVPLELRAALDLAELLVGTGRAAEARAPLAEALTRCPEGLDRPEPARAASLLGALPVS